MVVLAAEITKGPRVTISEILIRGNDKTKEKFIRNRLHLKPGDRFKLNQQQKSFRDLYKTGLFSKVDLHLEKQEGTDRWPLVVEVTEAPGKELYFEPGWGSYELLRLKAGFREREPVRYRSNLRTGGHRFFQSPKPGCPSVRPLVSKHQN